jgi:MarR family transcriptional regulator, lower aerobic nicotinate degradation pathway regulator
MKQKALRTKSKPLETQPLDTPQAMPCFHKELKKYLGYCFYKTALALRSSVDQRYARFGLVAPQYGMLIILNDAGPLTQNQLGQSMVIDKATMVRMIDVLQAKSYVTRTQSKTDRRANYLEITKAGRAVLQKLDLERRIAEDEFLKPLTSAERTQLTAIIDKLVNSIKAK